MDTRKYNTDHNPYNDRDSTHDNDNNEGGEKATAPAPTAGLLASTSLAALKTVLNRVDTASVVSRPGLLMLQFKSRVADGTWMYGQKQTVVENGSRWALNPTTFQRGYVCFNATKKNIGECLVPISQPMPDIAKLPDKGFPWSEQWAVDLKCLDGADAGTEVVFKTTTVGGFQALVGTIETIRDRLNAGECGDEIVPIVKPEKYPYTHPQYGRTWNPLLTVVDWMSLDGPAPAPAPASPPPPEQPRRRRVA